MSESKQKFTPGLWRVWRHVNEKYPPMSQTAVFGTGDKKFVMIAQMHDDGAAVPEQTVEEIIANAHLIAAAPEMLEHGDEVTAFLAYLLSRDMLPYPYNKAAHSEIEKWKELSKKARGEENE